MSLSFAMWAMKTFDGENFALCGKTIQSLQRNVIVQLKRMLASLGYRVIEHRSEHRMTVSRGGRENEFYLFGGKDESSQDLIQGITLAGVFFDEVALMPESFVNQATARCSVAGSKFWFNCNPEGPDHYFKKEWVDKLKTRNLIRIHFQMSDNPSLSRDILEEYERQYSGVFYDRFIRGLWVLASGLIFRYFAEDDAPYLYGDEEMFDAAGRLKLSISKVTMGIDFGGRGSKTTFCLTGYLNEYHDFRLMEESGMPLKDDIDAKAICDSFVEFYRAAVEKYGRVDWIFPDSASPTMVNSLQRAARGEDGKTYYIPASMTYQEWKKAMVEGDKAGFGASAQKGVDHGARKGRDGKIPLVKDITRAWTKAGGTEGAVIERQEYIVNGTTYKVDGKHVILRPTKQEREVADVLSVKYGKVVEFVPQVMFPQGIQTPDYLVDGEKYDLKSPAGRGKNLLYGMLAKKNKQSPNFIFDITDCPLSEEEVRQQIDRLYMSCHTRFVKKIIVIKNGQILKVYDRQ